MLYFADGSYSSPVAYWGDWDSLQAEEAAMWEQIAHEEAEEAQASRSAAFADLHLASFGLV